MKPSQEAIEAVLAEIAHATVSPIAVARALKVAYAIDCPREAGAVSEAPQWTNKPPTEPGLYWYAMIDSDWVRRKCVVLQAADDIKDFWPHLSPGDLYVYGSNKPVNVVQMHRVWAGPLRVPMGYASHEERVAAERSEGDE